MKIQCGYVNDPVFVTLLPRYLEEMKGNIVTVMSTIGGGMQQKVWDEMDYRIDKRRVT